MARAASDGGNVGAGVPPRVVSAASMTSASTLSVSSAGSVTGGQGADRLGLVGLGFPQGATVVAAGSADHDEDDRWW